MKITTDKVYYNGKEFIATLLPKDEINPAPLGESSEEQKPRFGFHQIPEGYALFINFKPYTVDDHFFQRFSTVMQEWESISPEEFYHCHSKGMGKKLRIVNSYDSTDIVIHSPTSEAPEEQEELWKEVTKEFENAWPWLSRHIKSLSDKYTIHRKRD